jgi:hypothetical protein
MRKFSRKNARPIPNCTSLLGREPSTETLVVLVRGMVRHFLHAWDVPDQQEAQRLRLMITSHLDDGEFARLIYDKVGNLIGRCSPPRWSARWRRGTRHGRARAAEPVLVCASHGADDGAGAAAAVPCLSYGNAADLERQLANSFSAELD